MNLLSRYVSREIAFAATGAIGLFILVFMTGNALRDVLGLFTSGRIPLSAFLNLLSLLLPFVLAYALPLGTVTGILIALGKLSANQEVTAMRAAGMGLSEITRPVLVFAVLISLASAIFNLYLAPETRSVYKSTIRNVVRANPVAFVRPGEIVRDFPGFLIYVNSVDGNAFRGFWIWQLDPDGIPRHQIQADRGSLRYDESTQTLLLELQDATAERRDPDRPDDLGTGETVRLTMTSLPLQLPLDRILGSNRQEKRLKYLSVDDLLAERRLLNDPANTSQGDEDPRIRRTRIDYLIHSNIAMSFATVSLALVAIPLGIQVGRRESWSNIAIALGLAMGYFFLSSVTSWFERSPDLHPHLLVHLPNIAFITLGILLFRRINRN